MRHVISFFSVLVFLALAPVPVLAQVPVFPGGEGHGIYTAAGRGGAVIEVTNLNDSGPGSLRAAVTTSGARFVIFRVSGYIDLVSTLEVTQPFLTVAGQTAPPPGITLRRHPLKISTHDVLVQHIRCRTGTDGAAFPFDADALQIFNSSIPTNVYNVVVDHCSISWATDENIDIGSQAHDVTVSNCINAQSLRYSICSLGMAGYGALISDRVSNLTLFRNIWAHTGDRNPKYGDGNTGVLVNNVVHNPTRSPDATPFVASVNDPIKLSVVGNLCKEVEMFNNLTARVFTVVWGNQASFWREGSRIYIDDNECRTCTNQDPSVWADDVRVENSPFAPETQILWDLPTTTPQAWPASDLSVLPWNQVEASLFADAGAFPDHRDAVDLRIVSEVDGDTGGVIDCVSSGEMEIDSGGVVWARNDSIVVSGALSNQTPTYVQYKLRLWNGVTTYERVVTKFDPAYGGGKLFKVNTPATVDNSYSWKVYVDCVNNGGGWPTLSQHTRGFVIPSSPNGDDDSDGYTNLEEWLHTFPRDSTVVSNFSAYTDSTAGGALRFQYQYALKAKWNTNVAAKSYVQYRVLGGGAWTSTTQTATASTNHYRVVYGLSDNTTYQVRPVNNVDGVLSYGPIATATTASAGPTISAFSMTFGAGPQATFIFTTSSAASCRINVRQQSTSAWGTYEFTNASSHGTSHSHSITGLAAKTIHNAYIQVDYSGDDTVFPDGAVPDQPATTIFIRFTTPNNGGHGGSYEIQAAPMQDPEIVDTPEVSYLGANYPNPFNPSTTIDFGLAQPAHVNVAVYDVSGRLVKTLVEEERAAGQYRAHWDGRDRRGASAASGVYFVRMIAGSKSFVRKIVMLK